MTSSQDLVVSANIALTSTILIRKILPSFSLENCGKPKEFNGLSFRMW